MDVRFVPQEEIDKIKWNSCVHYAPNGNIFGYKWFLDAVAKDWDALVEGDYQSVMPLVWTKSFWGKKFLTQPSLIRELGVYTVNVLSKPRIQAFLKAIPKEFVNGKVVMNEQHIARHLDGFNYQAFKNYQLLLNQDYESIRSAYLGSMLEELEKAQEASIIPVNSLKPERIADFYKANHAGRENLEWEFHALQRIMYNALHRGWGFATGIQNSDGELLAANFFLLSHHKVISLAPSVSKAGEKVGALPYLFDLVIRNNAQRPGILDFNLDESWIRGFGAISNTFFSVDRK